MGIEKTFRNSTEILKVSDIALKHEKQYQTVIVTFQSKVLEALLEDKLIKELPLRKFGSSHGKYPIYELTDQKDTLFYLSPITAPAVVGILEEIIYAFDIQKIILYGSCGVLDKSIAAGKIIVPTKAYRDEGTSYHYAKASDFIDIDNHHKLALILDQYQVPYVKGYTWTTDAFYRETESIVKERKALGCITVEMEISAVQAFANLRGVAFYTFIYGADNLDANVWDKRILGNLSIDERVKYFLLAKSIAQVLNEN